MKEVDIMGILIGEYEFKKFVNSLMEEIWDDEVEIPILMSNRLKTTFAYFCHTAKGRIAKNLTFSNDLICGDYNLDTVVGIVKHELAHYKLFKDGSNFFGDGDFAFESELRRIGGPGINSIMRHAGKYHISICKCCKRKTGTDKSYKKLMKHILGGRYVSKCCRAKIEYGGEVILEDKFVEVEPKESRFKTSNLQSVKCLLNNKSKVENFIKNVSELNSNNKRACIGQTKEAINNSTVTIGDLVKPGPKGVTRTQVHPAIVSAIDNKNIENLKLIKETYPNFFKEVTKYLSKSRRGFLILNNICF